MSAFLKKELEDFGFVVDEPVKDVIVINNFLSESEVSHFQEIIKNLKEEDWMIEYTRNLKRFCLEKFGRDDVDNLVAEGKFEITQGWQDKNYSIENDEVTQKMIDKLQNLVVSADSSLSATGLKTLQRMQSEVQLKAHTDQDTDPSISYATIIYLNDDYVDGELFFTNKELELKPKPGSLVIFPGTEEFNHGVRHVGLGSIRYVLVGFIKVKDFYDNNKY